MSKPSRPLRAQKEFEDEKYFSESDSDPEEAGIHDEELDDEDEDEDGSDNEDEDEDVDMGDAQDDSDSEPEAERTNIQSSLRQVDFGTLADAQTSLDRDRRRTASSLHHSSNNTTRTDAEKVNTLRDRLAELKALKSGSAKSNKNSTTIDPTRSTAASRNRNSMNPLPPARSSKHAPAEKSSKHQVTRRRNITDLPANPTNARDPRFSSGYISAATAPDPESTALKHNYAFLQDYRTVEVQKLKDEVSSIKARASKRKSRAMLPDEEVAVSRLRVAINRADNRAKAEKDKERAQEVVRKHKREEREKVAQGKRPYFLKDKEVRTRALTEKFGEMKAKERDRAVKRRQKKLSERERRSMPGERRGV